MPSFSPVQNRVYNEGQPLPVKERIDFVGYGVDVSENPGGWLTVSVPDRPLFHRVQGSAASEHPAPNATNWSIVPGIDMYIVTGDKAERWIYGGSALMRADSANWTRLWAAIRIEEGTTVIGDTLAGNCQSHNGLQDGGWLHNHIPIHMIVIPAYRTYRFRMRVCGTGAFGGFVWPADSNLWAAGMSTV